MTIRDLFFLAGYDFPLRMPFQGVQVDSRLVQKGNVFFALPGTKTDGHLFLEQAKAQGAAAFVVQKSYLGDCFGLPFLVVDDVLECLQNLAKHLLLQQKIPVVAVTGSVGKSSTKEMIAKLLEKKFKVTKSPGNSNSQIGVPLTILNELTGEEEVLVLEMGMTEKGHLSKLIQIAPPSVSVITSIAYVHACNFKSLEDIAKAKGEVLLHPKTTHAFLPQTQFMKTWQTMGACHKQTFSIEKQDADFFLEVHDEICQLHHLNKVEYFEKLPLLGRHVYSNFLAALAVAKHFGVTFEDIRSQVKHLKLLDHRLQPVKKQGILFINDSYNACDLSMKAALMSLPLPNGGGRKIGVFGEMGELGSFSESCHRDVAQFALSYLEEMFCIGLECRYMVEEWNRAGRSVRWCQSHQLLLDALREHLKEGDVVLLKGSRTNQLWKILDAF